MTPEEYQSKATYIIIRIKEIFEIAESTIPHKVTQEKFRRIHRRILETLQRQQVYNICDWFGFITESRGGNIIDYHHIMERVRELSE